MSGFQKARRENIPAKVALMGPSGSGKTYSALRIARGLAGPTGRIALIDTENGSASLYADRFDFDANNMVPPFEPGRFAKGIDLAAKEGYTALVIDGISPAWNGRGGVLEIVDAAKMGGNKFSGWATGTPAHHKLIEAVLACPIHLICTLRVKTEWVVGEGNKPEKIGLAPVQRDGIDYEFSVVGELDRRHRLTISKSRLTEVEVGSLVSEPDEEFGRLIAESLGSAA